MGVRRVTLGLVVIVLALLAGACTGDSTEPVPSGSSLAPLTVPPPTTASDGGATRPTTTPDPSSQQPLTPTVVLGTITVRPVDTCSEGRGALLVAHDPAASSILRQITAIVDGTQSTTTFESGAAQFEIPGVFCDGAVHTVLVATVDLDGETQSRAFAVRMPG